MSKKTDCKLEYKGKVTGINGDFAEITIYEDNESVSYKCLRVSYLKRYGLENGDSFILTIPGNEGIPMFRKDLSNKDYADIEPKSDKTFKKAIESQNDINEILNDLESNGLDKIPDDNPEIPFPYGSIKGWGEWGSLKNRLADWHKGASKRNFFIGKKNDK